MLSAADYARAERFMPYRAERLLMHTADVPTWLPGGKLWYRSRTAQGFLLLLVDPVHNTRLVVFDQDKAQRAWRAIGRPPEEISPQAFELISEDLVCLRVGAKRWAVDLQASQCVPLPPVDVNATLSPDGRFGAFVRDHNLWLSETETGREWALTRDGVKDFGYATDNSGRRHTLRPCIRWSPNSRYIATFQQDQRNVGEVHLMRAERGHAGLESWKYAMPGDAAIPVVHRVIVDVNDQRVIRLHTPPDFVRSAAWLGLASEHTGELEAQWTADSANLAFVSLSRDHRHARLRVAEVATGHVGTVLEERAATYYEAARSIWHGFKTQLAPNWRYLSATDEAIWYSSRSNWDHLYLYNLRTGLVEAITSGEWNVVQIVNVDERRRLIYFLAVGREAARNPYFEHLYRVCFDGRDLILLSPEDAAHSVSMSPSAQYFVDSYSSPQVAPVAVLRDHNGRVQQTLEVADISRLESIGWRPPLTLKVKARDGVTDLYGLMFKPSNFSEKRQYPIVNSIYPGPILGSVVAAGERSGLWGSFSTVYGLFGDAQALAELGFIVVMIDGLGTPLRSRTFNEACYGDYGDATLADQIAAMKQLARQHAWIDIERAGIYGHSGGGYAAARALLLHPEFFKVGIASAGVHDPASYSEEFCEKFIGPCQRDPNGSSNYDKHSNLHLAANLRGKLLLVHGTLDDVVTPTHTLLLVDALITANKDFDLLFMPNQTHVIDAGLAGCYLVRRLWDYFIRHLMCAVPPNEYAMNRPSQTNSKVEQITRPSSQVRSRN